LYDLSLSQLQGVRILQKTLNDTLEKITPSEYPKYIKFIDQLQKNIKSMQSTANENFTLSCSIDSILESIELPKVDNND
jgi:hypothetical protein